MAQKQSVLFLCTGNSCRSQMAEGFLRHCAGDKFEAYSAGTRPASAVHPLAIAVMQELAIDISDQHPKDVGGFIGRVAIRHLIITCDGANEDCPRIFPGILQRHFWPFDDPAIFEGSDEERLAQFRTVRNQIYDRIQMWLAELQSAK